jgi:hypothetical protein
MVFGDAHGGSLMFGIIFKPILTSRFIHCIISACLRADMLAEFASAFARSQRGGGMLMSSWSVQEEL